MSEHHASRVTVLISGSGTNLQALIDARSSLLQLLAHASIIRVISNRKSAYGLIRAQNADIPTSYHNLVPYKKQSPDNEARARERYDADLADLILADAPDLVVCAGWMHILSPAFLNPLDAAKLPVINLHPALPGAFDGANAIGRAYEAFLAGKITRTGVMIHYVIKDVDRGEPILVREVEMVKGESLEELEERIHAVEHEAIVKGTAMALSRLWEERGRGREAEPTTTSE